MKLRVLFDSSTLVSAALRADSVPDRALNLALDRCDVCASFELLTELERVLAKDRFDRYATSEARAAFVDFVRQRFLMVSLKTSDLEGILPPCRDASDNHILALAQVAGVSSIVSSDHDLLVLNPWRGIAILTPAEFGSQFSADKD